MTDAEHGGPWTELDHLENLYFDISMAKEMAAIFSPECKSVIDIGCGLGLYVAYLSHFLAGKCLGLEPGIYMDWERALVVRFDVTQQSPTGWIGAFDLLLCFEVAEHMPREKHTALFDAIASIDPKYVVFSGAVPNQDGLGHVSCRPEAEWIEEFRSRSYVRENEMSERLRKAAYWGWFQQNISVFRKV